MANGLEMNYTAIYFNWIKDIFKAVFTILIVHVSIAPWVAVLFFVIIVFLTCFKVSFVHRQCTTFILSFVLKLNPCFVILLFFFNRRGTKFVIILDSRWLLFSNKLRTNTYTAVHYISHFKTMSSKSKHILHFLLLSQKITLGDSVLNCKSNSLKLVLLKCVEIILFHQI